MIKDKKRPITIILSKKERVKGQVVIKLAQPYVDSAGNLQIPKEGRNWEEQKNNTKSPASQNLKKRIKKQLTKIRELFFLS